MSDPVKTAVAVATPNTLLMSHSVEPMPLAGLTCCGATARRQAEAVVGAASPVPAPVSSGGPAAVRLPPVAVTARLDRRCRRLLGQAAVWAICDLQSWLLAGLGPSSGPASASGSVADDAVMSAATATARRWRS